MVKKSKDDVGADLGARSAPEDRPAAPTTRAAVAPAAAKPKRDLVALLSDPRIKKHLGSHAGVVLRKLNSMKAHRERRAQASQAQPAPARPNRP